MVTSSSLLNALYFIVGAQQKLLSNDGSAAITAPDCLVTSQNLTCVPLPGRGREAPNDTHPYAPSNDDDSEHVRSEHTTSLRSRPRSAPQTSDEFEQEWRSTYLKPGSLVELYGDTSPFAAPAYVTGHSREQGSSSVKYHLANIVTNQEFDVDPEFIHPYRVYEDGTEANCNVGSLRKLYLTPCRVISHSVGSSRAVPYSYQVFYVDPSSNKRVLGDLPLSRVQRVLTAAHPRKMVA